MKHHSKKILSYIVTVMVMLAAALWAGGKFVRLWNVEFTDNASVQRHIIPVNSRVQGYIKEICFEEYEKVNKGDTLVIIDDSDMRLGVAQANAYYRNALAGLDIAGQAVESALADVAVSEAAIKETKVLMDNALADLTRYEGLLAQEAVTRQQYDKARTDYEAKKARYEMLEKQLSATLSVADISRQRVTQSAAGVELARVSVETAELNLSYTVILAPCDGYTSRKNIQPGQLVQPGQTLLDVVDSEVVWVTANYKETQLSHIGSGCRAEIRVDAIPGVVFNGEVRALSNATGASLSLIPQDNSAGNFVKVRQRIPVRIEFTGDNRAEDISRLSAGMNVECSIRY